MTVPESKFHRPQSIDKPQIQTLLFSMAEKEKFKNFQAWLGALRFSGQAQSFSGQAKPALLPPGYVADQIIA